VVGKQFAGAFQSVYGEPTLRGEFAYLGEVALEGGDAASSGI